MDEVVGADRAERSGDDSRAKRAFGVLSLVLVATVVAAAVLTRGNLTDDYLILDHLAAVRSASGDAYGGILAGLFASAHSAVRLLRPVVLASYEIDQRAWGDGALGPAICNAAYFLMAAFAAVALARRVSRERQGRWMALGAVLLLVCTLPAAFEVLTWRAARSESLGTLFAVLAVLLALRGGRTAWLSTGVAFLSLLSKESYVCFLPVFGLALAAGAGGGAPAARRRAVTATAVVTTLYLGLRFAIFGRDFLSPHDFGVSGGLTGAGQRFLETLAALTGGTPTALTTDSMGWTSAAWASRSAWIWLGISLWPRRGAWPPIVWLAVAAAGLGPLVLASGHQQIGPGYFNCRMAFLPAVCAGVVIATHLRGRSQMIAVLIIVAVSASSTVVRFQEQLRCRAGIEAAHQAIRSALESVPAGVETVGVLGFDDRGFAWDGFRASTFFDSAMRWPFDETRRYIGVVDDWRGLPDAMSFASCLERRATLGLIGYRPASDGEAPSAELLFAPPHDRVALRWVDVVDSAAPITARQGESLRLGVRVPPGLTRESVEVTVIVEGGRLTRSRVPLEAAEGRKGSDETERSLRLVVPRGIFQVRERLIALFVRVEGPDGASWSSGLRLIRVVRGD